MQMERIVRASGILCHVCVFERMRLRVRECAYVCVSAFVCVNALVCVCVCVCV